MNFFLETDKMFFISSYESLKTSVLKIEIFLNFNTDLKNADGLSMGDVKYFIQKQ